MLGVVAVADTPKPTSAEAVRAFQAMGIDVVMLTGDNRRTAEAVGRQLGVNRVVAEVLPQDKEKTVAELQAQGKRVAMVGDGINDAPPWPGPTWAWPSARAPTWPSSRPTWCS